MIPSNTSQAAGAPMPQLPELPAGPSLDSMRGPIETSTFEPWQLVALVAVGLLVLVFLTWQLIAYVRYRKSKQSLKSPRDLAILRLEQAQTLNEDGDFAHAHSNAFRLYLDGILKPNTKGWTTNELRSELTTHLPINGHEVGDFLEGCDQVKFAKATLSREQRIQLTDTTERLINSIEVSRMQALEKEGSST